MTLNIITTTAKLEQFCKHASIKSFITIDTEFMRDTSYYSKLCLVQIATDENAVIVDPLSEDIDLSSLYDLMLNKKVEKIFHAAKQDVEIFYFAMGKVPTPIFDTQVASMVLGYGDQIGYDTLVSKILGIHIDKGARFTDWSKRPLTEKQMQYAIGDVTHLMHVYIHLKAQLAEQGRENWTNQEMLHITTAKGYDLDPKQAYKRLKFRNMTPRTLAVLREVACVREVYAQQKNRPRRHIMKDETLLDIAASKPNHINELTKIRRIEQNLNKEYANDILKAVQIGLNTAEEDLPIIEKKHPASEGEQAIIDLLKALLKDCSQNSNVTPRILANAEDLKTIVQEENPDVPALKGWRKEIFGKRALGIKEGKTALAVKDGKLAFIDIP